MTTAKENYRDHANLPRRHYGKMRKSQIGINAYHAPGVAFTGTFLTTPTEAEAITGTQTIIITLTNGTWPASLSTPMKQDIIDAIYSRSGEAAGWNAQVRDLITASTAVVRTSSTVVTVTMEASPEFKLTADEVVILGVGRAALKGSPKLHTSSLTIANSAVAVTAALTGTFLTTPTEGEVVTGSQTIIITLTGDTWIPTGALFEAQRQAIINGLTSDGVEAAGWNIEVRDAMAVTTVVRTSDTAVTVTLPATAGYSIEAEETVTVTIPASALVLSSSAVVATETIPIQPD